MQQLLAGAEPFFARGGPVGCLVIHGFTGAPQEVRELGRHLAAAGHTVFCPRLPHHGVVPADLNRSRWHDWYLAAEDAWHVLAAQCEQVVVVGLSMGASTCLLLSTRRAVAGVVCLSAPLTLGSDWRLRLAPWIWPLVPLVERSRAASSWVDAGAPARRVGYRQRAVRGIAELVEYLEVVRAALPSVTAPVLLVQSRTDRTIPPESMDGIHDAIASRTRQRVWIEASDHAMTEDASRHEVHDLVERFVRDVTSTGASSRAPSPERQAP